MQDADDSLAQNKYSEAADLLRKAIAINPSSKIAVKALYKLGFAQETYLKDFEGALANYEAFIAQSNDRVSNYEVQKRIANVYFEQYRDSDRSIEAYKKLISLNTESLETDLFQFRVAQAYFWQNNFEQARYEYQQLLEHFPKSQFSARARFEIGNSYYMEGKYDIALDALKQVLRHNPQSEFAAEAQFMMGESFEHLERFPAALEVYESLNGKYTAPDVLKLRLQEVRRQLAKKK